MKLRRQPIIAVAAVAVVAGIVLAIGLSSKKDKAEAKSASAAPAVQPLNISVMLDLSDRLIAKGPNDNIPQMEKDTTIIAHLRDWFIQRQVQHRLMTEDVMRVFFYPSPNLYNIQQLQDNLTVDLRFGNGKKLGQVKKHQQTLLQMPATWSQSLEQIYTTAIAKKQWVGADVWGYFNHSAKNQCIREGYRNILIILTDGYLYHVKSWQKTQTGVYTGITSITVGQQTAIAPIADDMSDLEVLFLEINPMKPNDFDPMRQLLIDWCHNMGVQHCDVVITDVPQNNYLVIDNFLKH
ncbi:MAG: hypothetical protein IJ761_07750 [Bacteroidales bacterium]|nr:hypothetical protein [Bacteroidales bacterium]